MANKIIPYKQTDEYRGLVAELVSGAIEFQQLEGEMRIKFKYFLATTIVKHPAYIKFAKGNQDFLEKLANDVRRELGNKSAQKISKTSLYDSLQVYDKYPSEKKLLEALAAKHEPIYWSNALQLLGREDSTHQERSCPPHICKYCGKKSG